MAGIRSAIIDRFISGVRSAAASRECVIGLDISTRAIGVARVSGAGMLLSTDVITASSDEPTFKVAAAVSNFIQQYHTQHPITHTHIEEPLKSFTPGRFNTQGLFKLAGLNSIIGYECWRLTQRPVELTHASSIRSFFHVADVHTDTHTWTRVRESLREHYQDTDAPDIFDPGAGETLLRQSRSGEDDVKFAVLRYVSSVYPEVGVTWTRTRTRTLTPTCFDRADAILVGMYGVARCRTRDVLRDPALFSRVAEGVLSGEVYSAAETGAAPAAKGGRRRKRAVAAPGADMPVGRKDEVLAAVMKLHAQLFESESESDTSERAGAGEGDVPEDGEEANVPAPPRRRRKPAQDPLIAEVAEKTITSATELIEETVAPLASPHSRLEACTRENTGMFSGLAVGSSGNAGLLVSNEAHTEA